MGLVQCLTTADVADRLGLSASRLRDWVPVLQERGYLHEREHGDQWCWSPELVEILELAVALMDALRERGRRPSLRGVLDTLERTGRLAVESGRGVSTAAALHAGVRALREEAEALAEARRALEREAARIRARAEEALREGVAGEAAEALARARREVEYATRGLSEVVGRLRARAVCLTATPAVRWAALVAAAIGAVWTALTALPLAVVPGDVRGTIAELIITCGGAALTGAALAVLLMPVSERGGEG